MKANQKTASGDQVTPAPETEPRAREVRGRSVQPQPPRRLEVMLFLPGLAGQECSDELLLDYICRVFRDHEIDIVGLMLPKVLDDHRVVDLLQAIEFAKTVAACNDAEGVLPGIDYVCPNLAGLARAIPVSIGSLLFDMCSITYNLEEMICQTMVQERNLSYKGRIEWAEVLVIAEAVIHRGGCHTELDELETSGSTESSALQKQALAITARGLRERVA